MVGHSRITNTSAVDLAIGSWKKVSTAEIEGATWENPERVSKSSCLAESDGEYELGVPRVKRYDLLGVTMVDHFDCALISWANARGPRDGLDVIDS